MKSEIVSFLNGNTKILTDRLKEKMYSYSEKMDYEKAMEYKELLDYINITTEKQKVDLDSKVNTDIVGYYTKIIILVFRFFLLEEVNFLIEIGLYFLW